MNENKEKILGQKAREDALLNFVSRQAQEAILDPNLPETYKDEVLSAAVGTIIRIAERRNAYNAENTNRSHTIYEAGKSESEKPKNIPPIINELNRNLQEPAPENREDFTVEAIAEKAGIPQKVLYGWLENDSQFSETLKRLKDVQENDPLKTYTEEDTYVNAMMIALLLLETRERHYKANN